MNPLDFGDGRPTLYGFVLADISVEARAAIYGVLGEGGSMATVKVTDAAQAYGEIERLSRKNAKPEVRRVKAMDVGMAVRQGDVYIHRVADSHPHGGKTENRQLAIGETQGSRHVTKEPSEVHEGATLPAWCAQGTLLGPLVKSPERFTVSHPEHAHVELPPGTYQVTLQMDARTMEAVRD